MECCDTLPCRQTVGLLVFSGMEVSALTVSTSVYLTLPPAVTASSSPERMAPTTFAGGASTIRYLYAWGRLLPGWVCAFLDREHYEFFH